MREYFKIKILLLLSVVTAAMLGGCESSDDTNTSQKEFIVSYLEDTHSPTLIAESEVAWSLDLEPEFYTVYPTYTYRYISTYYDADRSTKREVVSGGTISITYDLYEFTGSEISDDELPIYTNNPLYEAALIEEGLNTELWSFSPKSLTIGSGALLSSIEGALVGCREGDYVELYLTYYEGYKNDIIGVVEKESALRFRCTIEEVED